MREPAQSVAVGAPNLPTPVWMLVPHRPPMLFISRLLNVEGEEHEGQCDAVLDKDHPLLTDGRLERTGLIECVAQSVAALKGYGRLRQGLEPTLGYLVGVQDFSIFSDAYEGDTLLLTIRTIGILDGISVVHGTAHCGNRLLAEGKLKLYDTGTPPSSEARKA